MAIRASHRGCAATVRSPLHVHCVNQTAIALQGRVSGDVTVHAAGTGQHRCYNRKRSERPVVIGRLCGHSSSIFPTEYAPKGEPGRDNNYAESVMMLRPSHHV